MLKPVEKGMFYKTTCFLLIINNLLKKVFLKDKIINKYYFKNPLTDLGLEKKNIERKLKEAYTKGVLRKGAYTTTLQLNTKKQKNFFFKYLLKGEEDKVSLSYYLPKPKSFINKLLSRKKIVLIKLFWRWRRLNLRKAINWVKKVNKGRLGYIPNLAKYKKILQLREFFWFNRNTPNIGLHLKNIRPILKKYNFYDITSVKKLKILLRYSFRKEKKKRRYIWKKKKNRRKRRVNFWKKNWKYRMQATKKEKKKNLIKQFSAEKTIYFPRKLYKVDILRLVSLLNKLQNLKQSLKQNYKYPRLSLKDFYIQMGKKGLKYFTNFNQYYASFKRKKSNYYITVFNQKGEVYSSFSSGQVINYLSNHRRNVKTRRANFNITNVAKFTAKRLKSQKIQKLRTFLQPGTNYLKPWSTRKLIESFHFKKIFFHNIKYVPAVSHGLPKKTKKSRRI